MVAMVATAAMVEVVAIIKNNFTLPLLTQRKKNVFKISCNVIEYNCSNSSMNNLIK